MENRYLAKTEKEKTIKEHTDDLLKQYQILRKRKSSILTETEWDLLNYAIQYHDLGKVNTKFQNKLYKKLQYSESLKDNYPEEEEIAHNFLSPFFINTEKYKNQYGKTNTQVLLSAVYYHHDRELPKQFVQEKIKKQLEDIKQQIKRFPQFYQLNLKNPQLYSANYILTPDNLEDITILKSKEYILIKGLLNRIDHIASLDKKEVIIEENNLVRGKTIADKTKEFLSGRKYRPAQEYMLKHNEKNLIINSPTGSGKTEAALLWAQGEKTFYTLPRKVTINAIYQRIIQTIGYTNALLLHSDAYSYYQSHFSKEVLEMYDRSKKLSAPFIVTTVDQLFKIAFRYKGYEEILATLSYSKIIIDEIQMYSPKMLAYILIALKMITQVGGKFAIITATFPPMLYEFMNQLQIPYYKQEENFEPTINHRHKIKIIETQEINVDEILKKSKNKKVLVIVNTVRKAQELYELLKSEDTYLLHSNYLQKDRDRLEKFALQFEKTHTHGILISTQIVEASLDIDFDVLVTEMCSIDSLFQRMGRVYRKREYFEKEPNVYIYNNRNGVPYIIESRIYDFSVNEVKKYDGKLLTEEDKQTMIENVFDSQKNLKLKQSDYYKTIQKTIYMMENIIPNQTDKTEIDNEFRNINSISLMPDEIFEQLNNQGKIEEWQNKMKSRISLEEKMKMKEEMKQNIVNVTWRYDLQYDKQECILHSGIYRTEYVYEFDETTLKGRGLLIGTIREESNIDV